MRRAYSNSVHTNAFLIGSGVQDRLHFLEMLLHCCDLSGQVMTTDIAVEWGKRIMREFRNQVSSHFLLAKLSLEMLASTLRVSLNLADTKITSSIHAAVFE
jgi:3'5'-cyclic nucleotide phosphodiesterase